MNGWQLVEFHFENLFSFKKADGIFPFDQTVLILGRNLDDPGADSNGSGKSSLLDSLTWVIWNKTPRSENFADDILRRGQETAEGYVVLQKGEDVVKITRVRGKKSQLSFERIIPGMDNENLGYRTPTLTQAAIAKFFGFDVKKGFVDYLSQIYFSSMSGKGFLGADVDPAERQAVLERFLGLSVLDKAVELVKKDIVSSDVVYNTLNAKIDSTEELIERLGGHRLVEQIEQLKVHMAHLDGLISQDVKAREQLSSLWTDYKERRSVMTQILTDFDLLKREAQSVAERYKKGEQENAKGIQLRHDWEKLSVEYDRILKEIPSVQETEQKVALEFQSLQITRDNKQKDITELLDKQHTLKNQLSGSTVCPHCSGGIMVRGNVVEIFDMKIIEKDIVCVNEALVGARRILREVENNIQITLCNKKKTQSVLEDLRDNLVLLRKMKDQVASLDLSSFDAVKAEAEVMNDRYLKAKGKVEGVRSASIELCREYVELYKNQGHAFNHHDGKSIDLLFDDMLAVYAVNIKNNGILKQGDEKELAGLSAKLEEVIILKKALVELMDDRKELKLIASLRQYWVKAYPALKRKVLGSFVPLFESTVNRYLSDLEIAERVRFKTATDKKSGGLKAGFVIEVFDGKQWSRFNSYSGGEKSRILVSVGFALRELAVLKSAERGFNFLFVDELLDNLDTTGMKYFFDLLKGVKGQRFIITHTKPDDVATEIDTTLLVTKEGRVSSIAYV